jgi:hypothetical protein
VQQIVEIFMGEENEDGQVISSTLPGQSRLNQLEFYNRWPIGLLEPRLQSRTSHITLAVKEIAAGATEVAAPSMLLKQKLKSLS